MRSEQTCDLLELDTIVTLTPHDEYFWALVIHGREVKVEIAAMQRHHLEALAAMLTEALAA